MPTADTPVPRQLSEEERALLLNARDAAATILHDSLQHLDPSDADDKVTIDTIRILLHERDELLTALSSEREAGERRTCPFCSDLDVAHLTVAGSRWCPSSAAEVLATTSTETPHA